MGKKIITNKSNTINISQKLYKKIYDYCSLNEFTNEETNKFIEDCLEKGFLYHYDEELYQSLLKGDNALNRKLTDDEKYYEIMY